MNRYYLISVATLAYVFPQITLSLALISMTYTSIKALSLNYEKEHKLHKALTHFVHLANRIEAILKNIVEKHLKPQIQTLYPFVKDRIQSWIHDWSLSINDYINQLYGKTRYGLSSKGIRSSYKAANIQIEVGLGLTTLLLLSNFAVTIPTLIAIPLAISICNISFNTYKSLDKTSAAPAILAIPSSLNSIALKPQRNLSLIKVEDLSSLDTPVIPPRPQH